jgi:hypothetical protein
MCDNIAGFEETLDRIRLAPTALPELTAYLNKLLGTQWDTDAHAGWRVRWLESLGKVERDGDRYVAR